MTDRRGRLAGKTALVTGATSNSGRAIALRFAAEGAHVVASGRSLARGAEVVDEIELSAADMEELDALDRSGGTQAALERKWQRPPADTT